MAKKLNYFVKGLAAAVFTPFDDKGELDLQKIKPYCEHLLQHKVNYVYVNGTTGEGQSLTAEERKLVVEKWISVSDKRISVMVHVGSLNLKDTLELVRHAVKVGADAIATLPPLFFKPLNIDSLVNYCKIVAKEAPDLPFYYYHLPVMSHVNHFFVHQMGVSHGFPKRDAINHGQIYNVITETYTKYIYNGGPLESCDMYIQMNMEDFLQKAKDEIPNMVGIKFSDKDLVDLLGCTFVDGGRFNLLYGCDDQLMAGLVTGAHGAVGSLHNFMPDLYHRMIQHINDKDFQKARQEQIRGQRLCRIIYDYGGKLGGNVAALKMMMSLIGLDMGPTREPMRQATSEETKDFKTKMENIGFFEWH